MTQFYVMRLLPLLACASLSPALLLAEPIVLATPGLQPRQPQVTSGGDGNAYVVFGSEGKIEFAPLRDGEKTLTPTQIGELPKLALGRRRGPRITVCGDRLTVTAISHEDGMLHCWSSPDRGKTWSKQEPLNTVATSAREGLHAMASDGRGLACVAWLDLRNGGMELWCRTSTDGGATWQPETRIYASPDGHICQCCHPSLAISPKGEIAAMWRNTLGEARDMWMSISRDGGKTFGTAEKLGTGTWKINGCPMDGGALTFANDGKPIAVWRREKAIYRSTTPGTEDRLSEAATQPVIVTTTQGHLIAWEENSGVMLKRGNDAPQSLTAQGRSPVLAVLAQNKGTIAVWETPEGSIAAEFLKDAVK